MQQINFYLPEFRPNRDALRSVHMLWGALIFFVLLCLVSVAGFYKNTEAQKTVLAEQQTVVALQAQVQKMLSQKPAQSAIDLDAEIEKLQKELQRRRDVLATISNQHLGNDKGFSAQLSTLAQASMNSLSLDKFSLQYGGTYAELSGKTRSADQIPLYLQRLQADPSFEKVGFGVIQVAPDRKDKSVLRFSVAKYLNSEDKVDTPDEGKDPVAMLQNLNAAADQEQQAKDAQVSGDAAQ